MFKSLYPYQEKYLEGLPDRYIFSADLGTGKTALSIVHYIRRAYPQPLLILAPASKVRVGDWDRELIEIFNAYNLELPRYEIYSYDKFAYNPTDQAFRAGKRALWHKFAPHYGGEQWAVIADEVHFIKQPTSNRSKATYWATKDAKFFVGLSGTPLPNGWIDFAGYSRIFGFVKNITEFKKRYCDIQTYKGYPEIVGYWREGELAKQWASVSKPLSREDASELPARAFYNIRFNRPKKYIEYLLDRKNDKGQLLDNPSLLLHALRQTTIKSKLGWLDELLEGADDNIVIFYNYESELTEIKKLLKKHKRKRVFEQNGHKHQLPTKDNWDNIRDSVTLAHYKSAATGVEMQYANITVYLSPTYSYSEYEQSKGRTHRNGQTRKCIYYRLYTNNTVERDIWECLASKQDFSEKLWIKNTIDNIK
jgi:superfamily II DNA or RNA helicase